MNDPRPNPLVTALALQLVSKDALAVEVGDDDWTQLQQKVIQPDEPLSRELVDALATDSGSPELVTFAGYLGGTIRPEKEEEGRSWRVLYLDAKLRTWLLVNPKDILLSRRMPDETSPFGKRDVIWLRSSASVSDGTGPVRRNEIEAQFVRGDFVGAGDFSASLTGGTYSRATGLLCEVQTPGCCGRYTRRP